MEVTNETSVWQQTISKYLHSHSGASEDAVLLEFDAVCLTEWNPTFRQTVVPSYRSKSRLALLYFFLQSNTMLIATFQVATASFSTTPPTPQIKCIKIKPLAAKATKLYNLKLCQYSEVLKFYCSCWLRNFVSLPHAVNKQALSPHNEASGP